MLIKKDNLDGIFLLYEEAFDPNFVVALPNFNFYVLKNGIIKRLSLDEVSSFLNKEYNEVYEEYSNLYNLQKEVPDAKVKKEKANGKRDN